MFPKLYGQWQQRIKTYISLEGGSNLEELEGRPLSLSFFKYLLRFEQGIKCGNKIFHQVFTYFYVYEEFETYMPYSHCFSRFWLEPSLPWAQPTEMAAYTLEMSSSMSMGFQWLARPTAMSSTLCTTQPGTGRSTSLWEERCYVEVCNSRQQQELEARWWDVFVRRTKDAWNKIFN